MLDHGIVAIIDGEVKKVRCGTCSFEHPYRQGKGGRPKKSGVQSLFEQVAATMPGFVTPPSPSAIGKRPSTRKKR
jgi:hypothetical protein